MAAKKSSTKKKSTAAKKKGGTAVFSNKQIAATVAVLVSVLFFSFAVVDAGGPWGALRTFTFGMFGIGAFVIPVFTAACGVVCSLGKDSKKFKQKAIECSVILALLFGFIHIIIANSELTYGAQISEAYNIFKNYTGEGLHFGVGVFGAVFGGIPLLLTGGSKFAAGIIGVLLLLAALFITTGTTIAKLIVYLKKPADAVGEYAEEKIGDMKESYTAVADDMRESKAKKAERKAEREALRGKAKSNPLDIQLDEKEAAPDMGLDSFLAEKGELGNYDEPIAEKENKYPPVPPIAEERGVYLESFEKSPAFDAPPLDEIFGTAKKKTPAEAHLETAVEAVAAEAVNTDKSAESPDKTLTGDEAADICTPTENEVIAEKVYELPPVSLLSPPKNTSRTNDETELREKGERIVKTLASFGVGTKIVEICRSPSVTRFELQPDPGVKISRITALSDDIAMNLAASGVRIEAPIPNKNAVGIEVPNAEKVMVTLHEVIDSKQFKESKSKLTVALGRDIQGEVTCADLAKMPHLLVAGTTGSGKSVCLNTMIMSILFNAKPDEVKLIMIDPKKVEFTVYRSIPHLLVPVVNEPRKAAGALSWAVAEMDKRYALFAEKGVRNLQGYNTYAAGEGLEKMPQIVIIIDELSDLMMAASNEVEDSICRLAQKARAAGMHLIVATQRPSVDVITGLIKANVPSRIAFAVKSQIDSRTIIDTAGAEKLLGNGDMLFCPVGLSKPVRVQGAYVSDDDIESVIDFVTSQGEVKYDDGVMQEIELKAAQENNKKKSSADTADFAAQGDGDDEMIMKAIEVVVEAGMASTTLLQRKLKLGYARAARIVDELSEKGVIGPFEGSKPRKVLITKEQWYQMQANSQSSAPKQLSLDDVGGDDEPNYFGSSNSEEPYEIGANDGPLC